ncbi:hypothetical protein NliqN6_2339 [Naganishia liquefaciens]|uniref:Histone deacetylase domain-containing protein n=1 Tax=Naganishia liquefaciens TaxID=104408 RepID=A0A8H3TRK9_9TREE|nr:hypothetical protein NliqN6_2339 [Naganishia liquefaciens]
MPLKVAYVHSPELESLGNIGTHPSGRSARVHRLIESLHLLTETSPDLTESADELPLAKRVRALPASRSDLLRYHSQSFLDFLLDPQQEDAEDGSSSCDSESDETVSSSSLQDYDSPPKKKARTAQSAAARFGLQDDCPAFPKLASYVEWIAGSTLTAASLLVTDKSPATDAGDTQGSGTTDSQAVDIAINWEGGRHHALRDKCSGFCYVQDVVLGIDLLRRSKLAVQVADESRCVSTRKPRIMYIDLDVHFGDAPAAAFKHPYRYSLPMTTSQKRQPKPTVMTVSVHHQSPGFFPSNSEADLTLATTPTPCTVAIPLRRGASINTYSRIWQKCIEPLRAAFEPDYVVLLLGMDALAGDKLVDGAANWSTQGEGGVTWCIQQTMKWGVKLLVLGGGGYHRANTARGWAIVTSTLLGRVIPEDVPAHDYWREYSPSFQMHVQPTGAKDENDAEYLARIEQEIRGVVERVQEIYSP